MVSIGSCSIVVGIWAENGTESLLLSLREVALGVCFVVDAAGNILNSSRHV